MANFPEALISLAKFSWENSSENDRISSTDRKKIKFYYVCVNELNKRLTGKDQDRKRESEQKLEHHRKFLLEIYNANRDTILEDADDFWLAEANDAEKYVIVHQGEKGPDPEFSLSLPLVYRSLKKSHKKHEFMVFLLTVFRWAGAAKAKELSESINKFEKKKFRALENELSSKKDEDEDQDSAFDFGMMKKMVKTIQDPRALKNLTKKISDMQDSDDDDESGDDAASPEGSGEEEDAASPEGSGEEEEREEKKAEKPAKKATTTSGKKTKK